MFSVLNVFLTYQCHHLVQETSPQSAVGSAKPVAVVAPYDEVTEDEITKRPTRKAPPPPTEAALNSGTAPTDAAAVRLLKRGRSGDPDQASQHSYDEIAAEAAAVAMQQQQQMQDLSPIYEEIPGGSRSSVSSGGSGGSGRSLSSPR